MAITQHDRRMANKAKRPKTSATAAAAAQAPELTTANVAQVQAQQTRLAPDVFATDTAIGAPGPGLAPAGLHKRRLGPATPSIDAQDAQMMASQESKKYYMPVT